MQILAFLARRGKGVADRLTGKNRDAVELAVECVAVDFIAEIYELTWTAWTSWTPIFKLLNFSVQAAQPVHADLHFSLQNIFKEFLYHFPILDI